MVRREDTPRSGKWDARKVRGLRKRLGLSQQAMARELGVRQQTISDWETGLYTPRGASKRVLSMVAEESARYTAQATQGEKAGKSAPAAEEDRRSSPDEPG